MKGTDLQKASTGHGSRACPIWISCARENRATGANLAYQVSGEYAMHQAACVDWLNRDAVMLESLLLQAGRR